MTDDFIRVGRIGRPHGVRGEVTVLVETDDPTRFAPGAVLHRPPDDDLLVERSQPYRDRGRIVAFAGVGDRGAAETLRGTVLWADAAARRAAGPGEYWVDELVGLTAVSPEGAVLGRVRSVESAPGQDRLVVITADGREVLVPFVSALVCDPEGDSIVIRDPGGLF
ncbi:MAG TPA: ribosome maturation factor RimM [Acidimicrobiia bacterium]|nr:ribosome maturation factor RimM [Acidimicrobiia bacterium]